MPDEYKGYISKSDAIATVMFGANRQTMIAAIKKMPSEGVVISEEEYQKMQKCMLLCMYLKDVFEMLEEMKDA